MTWQGRRGALALGYVQGGPTRRRGSHSPKWPEAGGWKTLLAPPSFRNAALHPLPDSRRAALVSLGLEQQSPAAAHLELGQFAWENPAIGAGTGSAQGTTTASSCSAERC